MVKWETGFAQSDGERIYWESAGEGLPLVICHGAGTCHLSFYKQIAGLASDSVRIITWDQRGYCNSTLDSGRIGISVSARDLTAVLAAAGLQDKPVHLVGQAMGAFVACHWAIMHPELAQSLSIWDGPFALSEDKMRFVWGLQPDDSGVAATRVNRSVGEVRAIAPAFRERDRAGTFLYQSLQLLGSAQPSYEQVFAAAQAEPVPLDRLSALPAPILIGNGELDHVVDATAYADLACRLPNARRVVLPGCGHSPYFEAPNLWNEAVLGHARAASA